MKNRTLILTALAFATATPALAQTAASGLDARFAELDTRLEAQLRAGALTGEEYRELRNRLQAVQRLRDTLSANGLTAAERQQLQTKLDEVGAAIRRHSRDAQTSEVQNSDTFIEFEKRLQSMRERVDAGAASGQLTQAEVQDLRERITALAAVTQRYKADNVLSAEERIDLNTRYAAVNASVARHRHDAQTRN